MMVQTGLFQECPLIDTRPEDLILSFDYDDRTSPFTPESGHVQCTSGCLLWANSKHHCYSITS